MLRDGELQVTFVNKSPKDLPKGVYLRSLNNLIDKKLAYKKPKYKGTTIYVYRISNKGKLHCKELEEGFIKGEF